MVRTSSTMLPLGTPLPPFELALVGGTGSGLIDQLDIDTTNSIASSIFISRPLLLMILCAHCPFVKHIEPELTKIEKDYGNEIDILAVSSNSVITHPQDSPENLALQALTNSWKFPYLWDQDQTLAKALTAACTPDFFVFAPDAMSIQKLQYRGQLDESRPGNAAELTGKDLRLALDALLKGKEVITDQKPSIGCNIKWIPGMEPSWFRS